MGGITREENIFVVKEANKYYKYPRELLGKSIEKGILDEVKASDLMINEYRYPHDWPWFLSMKTNKRISTCAINVKHEFPACLDGEIDIHNSRLYHKIKNSDSKVYGLTYFLEHDYKGGSVLLAEIDKIVIANEVPVEMRFKNYKIYNSINHTLTTHLSKQHYDFLKATRLETNTDSKSYNMSEFIYDGLSLNFKEFHLRETGKKGYLRWSSGSSTIMIYNGTKNTLTKKLSFDLIRPGGTKVVPAIVAIKDGDKSYEFEVKPVLTAQRITLMVNLKPGASYIEFKSNSPYLDNGDPRNIVFGIGNYELE